MAGTNGKPKFLQVNRNDEIEHPKFRGTTFYFLPDTNVAASQTQITADQWVHPNVHILAGTADPILGPDFTELVQTLQQRGLLVNGEAVELSLTNDDPTLSHTITLGAGWNPSSITIPPNSRIDVIYKIATGPPVTFTIISVIPAGSANPAGNSTPPNGNFGTDFQLTPSAARDVIVRDATNSNWVPSGNVNGGHLPFLILQGTTHSPTNDLLHIDDAVGGGQYNNLADIRSNVPETLNNNFQLVNLVVSGASTFGQRGGTTVDAMLRTQIPNPPGPGANGYHILCSNPGVGDVFYVRSTGVTKITLSAGPPVTNIAVDASGQICAAASSLAVKENIVDVGDTSFVDAFDVRQFNYIGDNVKQIGAVVEELEPLIPVDLRPAIIDYKINFAYTDDQGVYHPMTRDLTKPQSINNQGVLFALLNEVKLLRARVAALEAAP
jgi:hypothetical protein